MVCSHPGPSDRGRVLRREQPEAGGRVPVQALGREVPLLADYLDGVEVKAGDLVLFENVRFNKGEKRTLTSWRRSTPRCATCS